MTAHVTTNVNLTALQEWMDTRNFGPLDEQLRERLRPFLRKPEPAVVHIVVGIIPAKPALAESDALTPVPAKVRKLEVNAVDRLKPRQPNRAKSRAEPSDDESFDL